MGRRGSSDEGGGSLDSLLDTLTNVVGILVIMLVVTLLGVGDAVRRIKWQLPDISEAKLAEYRRLADLKALKLSDTLADVKETEGVLVKLRRLEKEIDELNKSVVLDDPQAQLAQLKMKVAELTKEKDTLELDDKSRQSELERLRREIASLPEPKPAATKVIRMPNPRSPPPESQCVWFTCRYNRISVFDTEALLEEALRQIASSRYTLSYREHGKVVKAPATERKRHPVLREAANWVLDAEKLQELFTRNDIGNRDYHLSLQLHPQLKKESLYATLRKEGGETVEQLRGTISKYARDVRAMNKKKQYARFIVWPDSFEVYVRAREIIEKEEIPAGWMIYTGENWLVGYDFGLNVQGETAPPPPPPAAAPAVPVAPAAPSKPVTPIAILD